MYNICIYKIKSISFKTKKNIKYFSKFIVIIFSLIKIIYLKEK